MKLFFLSMLIVVPRSGGWLTYELLGLTDMMGHLYEVLLRDILLLL